LLKQFANAEGEQKKAARAEVLKLQQHSEAQRKQAIEILQKNNPSVNPNDTNYVFLSFVTRYLPAGLVGLVIVIVFAATMASTSAEWNALATATVIDVYKRLVNTAATDRHYLWISRLATAFWGTFAIVVSERASRLGTLVEAVNILGSLFYGSVLGIFVLAFFFKWIGGTAAFIAVILGELVVFSLFLFTDVSFLWYNVFGCLVVVAASALVNDFTRKTVPPAS
jgi:solute:Na+ symporter, SSS family